jgi:hypothetical protein
MSFGFSRQVDEILRIGSISGLRAFPNYLAVGLPLSLLPCHRQKLKITWRVPSNYQTSHSATGSISIAKISGFWFRHLEVRILPLQPSSPVSAVWLTDLRKTSLFPLVRPLTGNLRLTNLQIPARRPPVLERLSLLAIFQFPFWCGRDRFEMCERTVREAS